MVTEMTIQAYLHDLSSANPAPGGGSASALVGALAGALVQMMGRLSGEELAPLISEAEVLVNQLTHLAKRDAEAFNQVMAAFKLPKASDDEKKERSRAIQMATRHATEVPLRTMEVCLGVLALGKEMMVRGNKNALSDGGVAGLMAAAACRGASYNVLINLPGLKDQEFVAVTKARLTEILVDVQELEQFIQDYIAAMLG